MNPVSRRAALAWMAATAGASASVSAFAQTQPAASLQRAPRPIFVLNSQDATISMIDPVASRKSAASPPARSRTTCT
jgi:hypothetical protein